MGGYAAQRMLAARNERDSMRATLWFNIAHYSLRPWPWILVALASIAVYPTLDSIGAAFPDLDPSLLGHDLAYPAMLVFLPHGLLGLVVASLAAAYMSTISTHLNWGSSYVVDDFYRRFVARDRDEAHYVRVARVSTGLLIALSAALALFLDSAKQAFELILLLHAGSGLIFLLRWFWWRVNAWSEISGMAASATVALWFPLFHERVGFPALDPAVSLLLGVGLTTAVWLLVTFLTRPYGHGDAAGLLRPHPPLRPRLAEGREHAAGRAREPGRGSRRVGPGLRDRVRRALRHGDGPVREAGRRGRVRGRGRRRRRRAVPGAPPGGLRLTGSGGPPRVGVADRQGSISRWSRMSTWPGGPQPSSETRSTPSGASMRTRSARKSERPPGLYVALPDAGASSEA